MNGNQSNVANALNNFFNSGGTLTSNFLNVFGLTGGSLANALSQLSGEAATGAEHAAYQLTSEFLQLMLDPNVDGRGGGTAMPLAAERLADFPPDVALAYASVFKAPPKPTADPRWSVWAAGFGGSNHASGDPVVGSSNVTTSTYGSAAGMDYRASRRRRRRRRFALAGAGTSWGLAQGLGGGRSDAFQAGLYGTTQFGQRRGRGDRFASNWFTTNRTTLGDQLTARFDGQSYGGRLEAGYRLALPAGRGLAGFAPYAALQVQEFHTPSYSESDLTAGGFGLSYAAMNGTDARSELGARFDEPTVLGTMPLALHGRLAWAPDWVSNPALNASFESLPGTSFTVNGAPIPHDSALTSAGAQLFFTPNWSMLAKFDGEFASGSQTYAGTGTMRYTW